MIDRSRLVIEEDLDIISEELKRFSSLLCEKKIFVTGATGFFGKWLLETLIYMNSKYQLKLDVTILTRNFQSFNNRYPNIASDDIISFIEGDIRSFEYPNKKFDIIIHAATTSAEETFNNEDALNKFDTVAFGTRHLLNFAKECGVKQLLLTSSGSLYGKQPEYVDFIDEEFIGAPKHTDFDGAALGEAKRVSEFFASYFSNKHNFDLKIARCFAFVGPYLQMDIHYAIGNFIKDAIEKKQIIVNGDGSPIRSYMYTSDLINWLFTILFEGKANYPYNVGSDKKISILDLANLVASCFEENIEIKVLNKEARKTASSNIYVPSIQRAKEDLSLYEKTTLKEAIEKTIKHYQNNI